jgi:hypothetical protein
MVLVHRSQHCCQGRDAPPPRRQVPLQGGAATHRFHCYCCTCYYCCCCCFLCANAEHIFELPIEAGALQQPFLLQVVLLVFRALCMLFNGCTTGRCACQGRAIQQLRLYLPETRCPGGLRRRHQSGHPSGCWLQNNTGRCCSTPH